MNSKKGLSEVVTAILLVLLAVIAVIVVWAVIRPMLEKSAGEVQTSCLTVSLGITNVDESDNKVTVKRNAGAGEIDSLVFITSTATGSVTDTISATDVLDELESYTFTLVTGDLDATETTKVEVAAKVKTSSGDLTLCQVQDSMASSLFVA